jgi:formylglycine-generating enzyme
MTNMRYPILPALRFIIMLGLLVARSAVGVAAEPPGDMVVIPAGAFLMGATPEEQQAVLAFGWQDPMRNRIQFLVEHSGPRHTVHLDTFYIDKQEVTNQTYRTFVEATGHPVPTFWESPRHLADPTQPVVGVSWYDAQAFCVWQGKRLPTEAEWEKAARGTDGRRYPWGQEWDATRLHTADTIAGNDLESFDAWSKWQQAMSAGKETARPAAVGSYPRGASTYGVLDMAGNVWEWVADWYDPNYYATAPDRNPTGPATGDAKVIRGGGWDVPRTIPVTWLREQFIPPTFARSPVTGFRCAATTPPGWHPVQRQQYRDARAPSPSFHHFCVLPFDFL